MLCRKESSGECSQTVRKGGNPEAGMVSSCRIRAMVYRDDEHWLYW